MRGLSEGRRRAAARQAGPTTFVPGRLYGLRKWRLARDANDGIRLTGHGEYLWRALGETTWAECARRKYGEEHAVGETAPCPSCTCGLYAWHPWATINGTGHFALHPQPGGIDVMGVVEAWGVVHVHHEGFRAQYARPASLLLLGSARDSEFGRLVEDLAISHRAQLCEFEDSPALIRHCDAEGIGVPRSTVESLLSRKSTKRIRVDGSG